MALRKGTRVLAQWATGKWYAGKICEATDKKVTVRFWDEDTRSYSKSSTHILTIKAKLPFTRTNCGPYGDEHARALAALRHSSWPRRSKWVVAECMVRRRGEYEFEGYVGRIKKIDKRFWCCLVTFNVGGTNSCKRPEGVLQIQHTTAFLLSGPYQLIDALRLATPALR